MLRDTSEARIRTFNGGIPEKLPKRHLTMLWDTSEAKIRTFNRGIPENLPKRHSLSNTNEALNGTIH